MPVELTPLPAATVTLVRDATAGLEVLMVQRNFQSGFMPGMYMFPGGALEPEDSAADTYALCGSLDDVTASRRLGIDRGGLAYWVAAIRESFEEAGILLACDAEGIPIALDDPHTIERFRGHRHALNAGGHGFPSLVKREGLRLAVDRLIYFSHWITPVGAPRRYDTRFFVARAPARQAPLHDNVEAIERTRIATRRMPGLKDDSPLRNDLPVNRAFADVAQDEPVVNVEPGFEGQLHAFNLFKYLSRSDVTWNPSVTSVCRNSLFCPTTEEYILPVFHGNDRVEWFVQLSDEIIWDVGDKNTGAPRARFRFVIYASS